MVLNALLVSMVILVLIGMKGPLELIILQHAGLNLIEAFEVTLKTGSHQSLFKGGVLLMILVVQPLVFGVLSLRIIDKIHSMFVLAKLKAYNFLQLEQYGISVPKTKKDILAMVSNERPYPPIATTFGNTAAASMENIRNNLALNSNWSLDISISLIFFRGSKLHIIIALMCFIAYLSSLFLLPLTWISIGAAITLGIIIGPTLFLYSCTIIDFGFATSFVKRELRMEHSKYYDDFKKTLWESNKFSMKDSKICWLKAKAALLYLKCMIFSWIEVYSNKEKLSSYLKMVEFTAANIERLHLPGVSRRLTYLAQWRDNQFSFRCNPACDQVLRKHRFLLRFANKSLIV